MSIQNITTAGQVIDPFLDCIATSKLPLENLAELLKTIEHLPQQEKEHLKGAEMFNGGLTQYIQQLKDLATGLESIKLQLQ